MERDKTCQICGRPAIGMQIFGCCCAVVCEEHAEKTLLSLEPGEKKEAGNCYFWHY